MLEVKGITVRYSGLPVMRDLSLKVEQNQTVGVVGANGAGKTTLLKAIMGAMKIAAGQVLFNGKRIDRLRTEEIVRLGVIYVPEGRRLFGPLSVEENLLLGAYTVPEEAAKRRNLEHVYELFPRLAERKSQAVGSMSGGEQQMAAIGRGLMSSPKLLMLDEPSLGLAPLMVSEVFETVRRLQAEGDTTVLLVEQNVLEALELSDWAYILQTGRIRNQGPASELLASDDVRRAFLGL
ncbi:MAG: ABC transporter ATP-binding protein [Desulfarculaceae bacterium]|nr:ABC transporter ATP-binding protein [Desulfarculaceae bacterium]MCF8046272.1 ABC transporter ATP-binding protein [Desulfarculaceae bacterium]MCF8097077.1 ABC transporter ATP-binding protein [Desulfarculaceae bacterium]MCF8120945.1 ABC transporter ATP-binding protein [Desulfarculaceae bacterium]